MGRANTIVLPEPRRTSRVSVEDALGERRSVREFKDEALSLEELSQLLWAMQGP
jgi:nitroreductase